MPTSYAHMEKTYADKRKELERERRNVTYWKRQDWYDKQIEKLDHENNFLEDKVHFSSYDDYTFCGPRSTIIFVDGSVFIGDALESVAYLTVQEWIDATEKPKRKKKAPAKKVSKKTKPKAKLPMKHAPDYDDEYPDDLGRDWFDSPF